MSDSYYEILEENKALKAHIKKLERTALEKSIEFEKIKRQAGESAAAIDKILNKRGITL